jgi:hypothetical protein
VLDIELLDHLVVGRRIRLALTSLGLGSPRTQVMKVTATNTRTSPTWVIVYMADNPTFDTPRSLSNLVRHQRGS